MFIDFDKVQVPADQKEKPKEKSPEPKQEKRKEKEPEAQHDKLDKDSMKD